MRKKLWLFTGSYPYPTAAENTFLPQEIAVLIRHFENIVIVPTVARGEREQIDAPNVTVDTTYAQYSGSRLRQFVFAALSIADARFLKELIAALAAVHGHPGVLLRLIRTHVAARMTERWLCGKAPLLARDDSLLYTWWFDGATLGLAEFGRYEGVPVITRAHGYDLYENRHKPAYIPFRKQALADVTRVFCASAAGARYLAERYPECREKIGVSLLGVDDPGFLNPPSSDAVFRVLSCSFLVPVKRIDLMIRGIAAAGRRLMHQEFEWTHIGDGPEKDMLARLADSVMPPNVRYQLVPYPGKVGLLEHYRSHPADVFMNTSMSEGTPVAIMEAISVGIPVIGTAVGGNTEIVTSETGAIIPADSTPDQVATAIVSFVNAGREERNRLRAGSRARWRSEYSASRNYGDFAELIREL